VEFNFTVQRFAHLRSSQKQLGILRNLISRFFEKTVKISDNKVHLIFTHL